MRHGIWIESTLHRERHGHQLGPSAQRNGNQPPDVSKRKLLGHVSLPSLSSGAAARCNEGKPEGTGDSSSAADADRKQHPTEGERAKASSSRKRGNGSSAVAEAKGGEEAGSRDVGDGDEKGAGRGLTSLGDLPSLGRKMVSPRAVSPLVERKQQGVAKRGIWFESSAASFSVARIPVECAGLVNLATPGADQSSDNEVQNKVVQPSTLRCVGVEQPG